MFDVLNEDDLNDDRRIQDMQERDDQASPTVERLATTIPAQSVPDIDNDQPFPIGSLVKYKGYSWILGVVREYESGGYVHVLPEGNRHTAVITLASGLELVTGSGEEVPQ